MKVLITVEVPEGTLLEINPQRHPNVEAAADAGLIDDDELGQEIAAAQKPRWVCPDHGKSRVVPAGHQVGDDVTWKNGKPGKAFLGCPEPGCKKTADHS